MKYLIKKNQHYALPLQLLRKASQVSIVSERKMSAIVSFDESCRYGIGKDQSDINKLFGFSLGMHHTNSIRVGWRWFCDELQLCTYIYEKGVRLQEKVLCTCDFHKEYKIDVKLWIVDNEYFACFFVDGSPVVSQKIATKVKKYVSYPLSLYFGGNCTAPHDMRIEMNIEY